MNANQLRTTFLLLLLVFISAVFVLMIRQFLMTILLAAIAAGMAYPLYRRVLRWFGGRRTLASLTTLGVILIVVGGPLLAFAALAASEALHIADSARPFVESVIREPGKLFGYLDRIPWSAELDPYRDEIVTKLGQVVERVGTFFFNSLSATTRGTVNFFFQFFLFLYTFFFLLMDGAAFLRRILYYMPLPHEDEIRIVDKFVSVSRATLKGTFVIGLLQGGLAGVALAVAGIEGAVFWGTLMVVLSVIPGVGTGLVWGPAAIYLVATGKTLPGILLGVFCLVVVGSVDNLVRPRLVGKDVQMHELLILFSTLGGLFLFGLVGFVIGPVVAALFVTVWDIYGVAFRGVLPPAQEDPESADN